VIWKIAAQPLELKMRTIFPALLVQALLLTAQSCADGPLHGASYPRLRIMPLGDSITAGSEEHGGYRSWLWQMLTESGCKVDFVGSSRGPREGPPDFDRDHEGHWGWTTAQVLERLDGWLSAAKPDVALIHLGTNDLPQADGARRAADNLSEIIDRIRRHNPRAGILLSQIIPVQGAGVHQLNQLIAAIPGQNAAAAPPIVIVDQYSGFAAADTYDGIHPNTGGAKKMAKRWFLGLRPFLEGYCRPEPGAGKAQ
jgi:acyl-CoA thioesterase I